MSALQKDCGSAAAIGEGAGVKAESRPSVGGATGARPPITRRSYADWERERCVEQGYRMRTIYREPLEAE
jgi:hypothetical protein